MLDEPYALLIAPLCAFAGAVFMLFFRREEVDRRRLLLSIFAGPFLAFLITPFGRAWVMSKGGWVTPDLAPFVSGAIGCLIGMLALNILAFVSNSGRRVERIDPLNIGQGDKDAR
jgi:hypothetical protein